MAECCESHRASQHYKFPRCSGQRVVKIDCEPLSSFQIALGANRSEVAFLGLPSR
jgi:hypothetical protein